ncbi:osmoprotectant ABC transporter substrate-binding protein [Miniphocaeibacter massiliensis]|uniref:osmoprotectant ABC transporter substrate-binding protein n=1 Tax=Miniphocaeibacter massiliensis TaxID=2041841 RepID=UPI000C1BA912|nr:osmoprotectant ABC transporter substrate-binding protein [Miniphocaeibacter massiliensis]
MKNRLKKITLAIPMLLLLTSCSLPGLGGDTESDIVIASGNTTERQIVSEMVSQMLEHYTKDIKIDIINNLGSTNLIHQSLMTDNANISGIMYTGTSLTGELEMEPITDPEKAMNIVVKEYKKRFNEKWYPSYGFENTYAFMVTREFSEKNNITKVSQLKDIAKELKAGVDTAWIQRKGDGYEDFKRIYGYDFQKVYPMEIGLVYNAVDAGEMDIVLGYTTDGRIQSNDLVVLEDDKNLFPPYDASPAATYELIEKYPIVDKVLLKLEGTISSEQMQKLNRLADEELVEPKNVAKKFLEDNNYFKDKEPMISEAK